MNITRRGFMQAILAAGVAPAVVKAASLMRVRRTDGGLALIDELGEEWQSAFFKSTPGPVFTVPEGVNMAWITFIGGGGGGLTPKVAQLSPHEWADGTIVLKPIATTPGQRIPVSVGTRIDWMRDGALVSTEFK